MNRPLRAIAAAVGLVLAAFGIYFAYAAASAISFGMLGYGVLSLGCCMAAGICFAPQLVPVVARPLANLLGGLIYPEQRFEAPPPDLLRKLRQSVTDRHFDSVAQQVSALDRAYGPSPELLHLAAHLAVARGDSASPVTTDASQRLKPKAFEAYLRILRDDPPRAAPANGGLTFS